MCNSYISCSSGRVRPSPQRCLPTQSSEYPLVYTILVAWCLAHVPLICIRITSCHCFSMFSSFFSRSKSIAIDLNESSSSEKCGCRCLHLRHASSSASVSGSPKNDQSSWAPLTEFRPDSMLLRPSLDQNESERYREKKKRSRTKTIFIRLTKKVSRLLNNEYNMKSGWLTFFFFLSELYLSNCRGLKYAKQRNM